MSEKKEEILKWLSQFGRLSTSRFVGFLGINYESVKVLLEQLKQEGKIVEEKETHASYWRLKNA